MRPLLLAAALCAITASLPVAPALAEQAASWVDPPAKSTAPTSGASEPSASRLDAAKPDPSRHAASKPAETVPAAATNTDGRRAERRERRITHREAHRDMQRQERIGDRRLVASEGGSAGRAGAAQRLAQAYLGSISSSNAATLAATPRFYGAAVRFHGRTLTTAALIAEKRRFFRRWPERRYAARDGSTHTACAPAGTICTVRTLMGFRAASPERGVRSTGLSELVLTVSFAGERPVIVSESSRVLRRGAEGRPGGA